MNGGALLYFVILGGAGLMLLIAGLLLLLALIGWPLLLIRGVFRLFRGRGQQRRQLAPFELNRRRALISAFVLVCCITFVRGDAWPLDQLPPWAPVALAVIGGLSCLSLLTSLYGARNGPRDAFAVLTSLVIAGGAAALLWWQWYFPPAYGVVADYGNRLLPGLYMATAAAALLRALICVRLLGGANRIIARWVRQRARTRQPVSMSLGFWARTRAAFAAGRAGRPWE